MNTTSNFNGKNSKTIKCRVCDKEILYNENGTCEDCHKKILERLEEKRKNNTTTINENDTKNNSLICSKCGNEMEETIKNGFYCRNCDEKDSDKMTENTYLKSKILETLKIVSLVWLFLIVLICFNMEAKNINEVFVYILISLFFGGLPYIIIKSIIKHRDKIKYSIVSKSKVIPIYWCLVVIVFVGMCVTVSDNETIPTDAIAKENITEEQLNEEIQKILEHEENWTGKKTIDEYKESYKISEIDFDTLTNEEKKEIIDKDLKDLDKQKELRVKYAEDVEIQRNTIKNKIINEIKDVNYHYSPDNYGTIYNFVTSSNFLKEDFYCSLDENSNKVKSITMIVEISSDVSITGRYANSTFVPDGGTLTLGYTYNIETDNFKLEGLWSALNDKILESNGNPFAGMADITDSNYYTIYNSDITDKVIYFAKKK